MNVYYTFSHFNTWTVKFWFTFLLVSFNTWFSSNVSFIAFQLNFNLFLILLVKNSTVVNKSICQMTSCQTLLSFFQSPAEISDYSSNDGNDEDPNESRAESSLAADTSKQSVSEWIRSAQAILQTPQKQTTKTMKTPEDSSKKRRRFERYDLLHLDHNLHFGATLCKMNSIYEFRLWLYD